MTQTREPFKLKPGGEPIRIHIICPVRDVAPSVDNELDAYVASMEKLDYIVHYPKRDVDQTDDGCGEAICKAHLESMRCSDVVMVWYDLNSGGTLFDLGMAFALDKPIRLIHVHEQTPHKSFGNVVLKRAGHYKESEGD